MPCTKLSAQVMTSLQAEPMFPTPACSLDHIYSYVHDTESNLHCMGLVGLITVACKTINGEDMHIHVHLTTCTCSSTWLKQITNQKLHFCRQNKASYVANLTTIMTSNKGMFDWYQSSALRKNHACQHTLLDNPKLMVSAHPSKTKQEK